MKPCRNGHLSPRLPSGRCQQCSRDKEKRRKDPAARLRQNRESRQRHLEKRRAEGREKYRRDPAAHYARKLKWDKAHPEYLRHRLAMYRARLAQATPPWLTKAQLADIRAIYASAQEGQEVDHVIPLHGKTVCGLHVPWNLQVLPRSANRAKGNSFNG